MKGWINETMSILQQRRQGVIQSIQSTQGKWLCVFIMCNSAIRLKTGVFEAGS
jgi:hypothetical protein